MRRLPVLAAVSVAAACLSLYADAQIHRVSDEVRRADLARRADVQELVMVPMRDGVRLATTVYTPKGEGPWPVIFWRTPYNFSPLAPSNPTRPNALLKYALDAVDRGYAFVVQNERGRYFSEGEWRILGHPRTDGYDALTWLAEQPWSTGRVATLGCSSTAEWQMGLAAMNHPAHAAAVPMAQGAGIGRMGPFHEQGNFYRGGAVQMPMAVWLYGTQNTQRPTLPADLSPEDRRRLGTYFDLAPKMPPVDWSKALWHLPVADLLDSVGGPAGPFADMIRRGPDDPAWYDGGLYHDDEGFGVPALWVNSWYDLSVGPNLALYRHVRTRADEAVRDHQYLVVAPTLHCAMYRLRDPLVVGEVDMGTVDFGFDDVVFDFLDRHTKGGSDDEHRDYDSQTPKVRYFAMGDRAWRETDSWPPANAEPLTLYLDSGGDANSLFGDGRLRADAGDGADLDRFTYDPAVPVPTLGGNFCCLGGEPEGAFDQRPVEARRDVLVYTGEPLEQPLDVAGSIEVILHVSSDAKDTDFTVKLVDVHPDGRAINLDDAILRARYRDGYDRRVPMEPGEVYELRLGPLSTANVFGVGHRVRIEISSSNFPRYDRNLNTGGNNVDESEGMVARNAVHHSPTYPSRIVLPVLR
ncbi:MAG: CocE/NonD family hydrolase [Acidobacteriota bacterium]